jgi:hypothetical protein
MNIFKRFSSLDRYTKLAIIVIAIAFLLRLVLAVIYSPSGDGCWYSSVARFIAENGRLPAFEHVGRVVYSYPPLYPLLSGIMYYSLGLFNSSVAVYGLRILNPVFSALGLWIVFLITSIVSSKKAAFYATLFLAFLPVHIYHGYLPYLEALSSLLASLAIYFLLKGRFWLAAIFLGLTGWSLTYWFAMIPVIVFLLYIRYRSSTAKFARRTCLFFAATFAILVPFWARNIILFGNPVYPYLVSVFGGVSLPYSQATHPETLVLPGISAITDFVVKSYLGFFGVPNGEPSNLFFFSLPFMKILLVGWLAATIIYFAPLAYGAFLMVKSKLASGAGRMAAIWLLSCLAIPAIASLSPGYGVHIRYVLLAAPAIGIIAARGFEGMEKILAARAVRFLAILAFAGIIFGFSAVEAVKTVYSASMWASYSEDFSWVKQNTPQDALFIAPPDQCYPYYLSRPEVGPGNLDWILSNLNVSYAWVNNEYKPSATRFSQDELGKIETGSEVAYNNTKTGTVIYKLLPISQK